MPFKVLMDYFPADAHEDIPVFMYALWVVGGLGASMSCFFVSRHLILEIVEQHRRRAREGRIITAIAPRLVRIIITCPLPMCLVAYLTLFFPGIAYFVELTLSIFAALVVGTVSHDFINAVGQPPETTDVLDSFAPRRWWCGSCCGGGFDPLCCIGLVWKDEFKLSVRHLARAHFMVTVWILVFVAGAVVKFFTDTYVAQVVMVSESGWCVSHGIWEKPNSCLGICALLSCFPGLAGLNLLGNAASLAVGERWDVTDYDRYNAKAKFDAGGTYLGLGLWRPVCDWIARHLRMKDPVKPVVLPEILAGPHASHNTSHHFYLSISGDHGLLYNATFVQLNCPVYDSEVISTFLFCTLVCVFMGSLSRSNWLLYPPGDEPAQRLRAQHMRRHADGEPDKEFQTPHAAGEESDSDDDEDAGGEASDEVVMTSSSPLRLCAH